MKVLLDDALKALEGRNEFAVKEYDERLICVNYLVTLPDSFEGIKREFRGITFDGKTGEVVSRPFHKFFNINQKEETQYHAIKHLKATVYEKLDGSMIHFFRVPREGLDPGEWPIVGSTRMSYETPQARAATQMARFDHPVWLLIEANIRDGFTPMFEFVGPDNQIVVQYPKRRLVYLHSRHRETGEYWFDPRFPDKAQRYEIDFGDIFNHLDKEEFEGYVSLLENGLWVKSKGEWYNARHKVVDDLMKPAYKLYEKALAGELDDVYSNAADRYKPVLQEIGNEVAKDFADLRGRVFAAHNEVIAETAGDGRKGYVLYAKEHYPDLFSGLMKVYDHREPTDFIGNRLMEKYKETKANKLFADVDPEG